MPNHQAMFSLRIAHLWALCGDDCLASSQHSSTVREGERPSATWYLVGQIRHLLLIDPGSRNCRICQDMLFRRSPQGTLEIRRFGHSLWSPFSDSQSNCALIAPRILRPRSLPDQLSEYSSSRRFTYCAVPKLLVQSPLPFLYPLSCATHGRVRLLKRRP